MMENSYLIKESQVLTLKGKLHHTITLQANELLNTTIILEPLTSGLLFLNYEGHGVLNLSLVVGDQSNVNVLVLDRSDEVLDINETVTLGKEAMLNVNYGEFSSGTHQKNTVFLLDQPYSHLEVRSATLTFGVAEWKMAALHRAKDTYAMLKNYGVVFENGKLGFEVLGDIGVGFSRSKTHQETRVMNMASELKATVFPKLIIDENDVEASHAASVGQPDPEMIYYLQSRGLTYDQAISQITLGYLLPVIDIIDDETIKENLTQEIKQKVNVH